MVHMQSTPQVCKTRPRLCNTCPWHAMPGMLCMPRAYAVPQVCNHARPKCATRAPGMLCYVRPGYDMHAPGTTVYNTHTRVHSMHALGIYRSNTPSLVFILWWAARRARPRRAGRADLLSESRIGVIGIYRSLASFGLVVGTESSLARSVLIWPTFW